MSGSCVVTVGNELLAGRVVDTNAAWLSEELRRAGFPVERRETVPDEEEALAAAVTRSLAEAPVVVVTGGLGPTADDLTRTGIARALDRELSRSAEAFEMMRAFFGRHGRELAPREQVQALLPAGALPLPNANGTAPGFVLESDGRLVVVLPGVPGEMRPMFTQSVLPRLAARADRSPPPRRRVLTVLGMPESVIGEKLSDLLARGRNPLIGSYPRTSAVVIDLEAVCADGAEADALLERDVQEIRRRLGPCVAGEGALEVHELVGRALIERGIAIAVAESLTGGLLSDRLVSVPGISAVFTAGLVTYSNAAKMRVLGVSEETLREHGAVSEPCAGEMAEGARRVGEADVALATTGIAGPTGAVPGKPVGTVCLGFATPQGTTAESRRIVGTREQVRERAVAWALDTLRRWLQA